MRIAIYTRKSVYREHSESIDTQIELCKNYFRNEENEYEVFIDEGFSGGNTNRPSFLNMMDMIKLGKFDVVAIYKIDRISRNIVDFFKIYEELEKYNVKLVSITENFDTTTPVGKMMMIMLSAFADMERENIRQRVKDNMIALAKKGCFTGGFVPFGCEVEKKEGKSYLKIVDSDILQLMFTKYLELGTLYATQKYLLDNNIKTVTARSSLRDILRNPVYCKSSEEVSKYLESKYEVVGKANGKGYVTYGKTSGYPTLIVGKHRACIDADLFLKVNMLIDKNREDTSKRKSKVYWLSGVLRCAYCGNRYTIANSDRNSYYVCTHRINRKSGGMGRDTTKDKCINNKYINALELENKVSKLIYALEDKEYFESVYSKSIGDNNKKEIDILENKINKNNTSIDNLVDKLTVASDQVSKILMDKIEKLTTENNELKVSLDKLKIKEMQKAADNNTKEIKECIHKFKDIKDNEQKRRLVSIIFKKLVYDPIADKIEVVF